MDKSTIQTFLMSNNRAVEAALLGLLARQTVGEQRTSSTIESNGRGFNTNHAEFGTSLAMWVKSGRRLTSRQLAAARPIVCYYWRQVAEMSSVLRLFPRPPIVRHKVSGEHELCALLFLLDRFQGLTA